MKFINKLTAGAASLGVTAAMLFSFGGVASADCYQYNANGFTTSNTPVFNNVCGAPENINNESDFVRIRQNSNGNDTDNANNGHYTIGSLTAACNSGDKFDVWNYLHNDASQDQNGNGDGTAVAHNVQSHMTAALGSTSSSFNFADTVSASNAASVSDSVTLNCNGKQVKLSLVPGSVHIYSIPYGGWQNLGDGSVNSSIALGSPTQGSGNVWGCWNYRIVVVYQVAVETVPTPVVATCDMFKIAVIDTRKIRVSDFKYSATNSNVKNVAINWGDNTSILNLTDVNAVVGQVHQYATEGTYNVTAIVTFGANGQADTTSGGAGTACAAEVTFTKNQPPVVTTTTAPKSLVNTGAGSTVAMFAAVTGLAAFAHRKNLARRLSK